MASMTSSPSCWPGGIWISNSSGPVFELLGGHLLVGLDAGLALGLPGLGRGADPLQLAGERLLPGGGLLLFDCRGGACFCSSHDE